MTTTRCPTTSGPYQCTLTAGHQGECETRDGGSRPSVRPRPAPPVVAGTRCPTCDQPIPEKNP